MADSTNILIFLFVLFFSMVAVSLILIQYRGLIKSDKRILEAEEHRQHYRDLLNEIVNLENVYPQNRAPKQVVSQIKEKRENAVEILQKSNPDLDKKLSRLQLEEDLREIKDRNNPDHQQQGRFICQNCGSQVQGGDKFCANCGFRLQG